jgi:hypothetical protein
VIGGHQRHFGVKVAERRRRLGLTLVDVNQNGGPTAPTLAKAEAGALDDPRPSTLSKFDTALQWTPGSAARAYWEGVEPNPRERRHRPLERGAGSISLRIDQVLALMATQSKLDELVSQQAGGHINASLVAEAIATLRSPISDIVGQFVTDLLERNYQEKSETMQPVIGYAFAELLSPPVDRDDRQREEKLYRRWLLGKHTEVPSDLQAAFRRKWRQSARNGGYLL